MYNRQLITMIYQHKGKILAFTILFVLVQISKSIAQKIIQRLAMYDFILLHQLKTLRLLTKV
jgi:hypothetical protein